VIDGAAAVYNPHSEIRIPQSEGLMAWLYLFVAGLMEVVWAVGLKYTEGFTRLWPSVWTGAALVLSMVLLAAAVKTLPLGTAYAVWTGMGAVGTAALGVILFGESASPARVASSALILTGLIGLKLTSAD
jgi:quaternary ammonium compound-resistance protein SugE